MNAALVDQVVAAVLYEGYILYPYRASSKKNRQRFTFGRVYPEAYSRAQERFRERAPLVLVGGFPDEFEGEHPDAAIERTGARDVHLAGWHEHAALARFLNAADLVVLPSVAEQFGQVLVEGMACERPVIAARTGGLPEVVRDGETGFLVAPGNAAALAERIGTLLDDGALRRRMGATARAWALEMFTWERVIARMLACYEAALSSR